MNDTTKVYVTYRDGKGAHTTTVKELKNKWEHEAEWWKDRFFGDLERSGLAFSSFGGRYSLTDEPYFKIPN